jgi:putative FmdB family regulatory protein
MPTYEYRCAKCGRHFDVYQSFSEDPFTKHEACGGKLNKVLSPAGIVLKGSGFYKTDSRSGSKRRTQEKSTEKSETTEKSKETSSSSSSSSESSGGSSSDGSSSGGSSSDSSSGSGGSSSGEAKSA